MSGCSSKDEQSATYQSTYQKVLAAQKITVGYISYPPSFIKDPNNGSYSGIYTEVIQKIGEKLGLQIDFKEELGWGTMIEAVKSKRVNLVCSGIWPTTERGKFVDFTKPLYYSTVRAYTRSQDNRFDGHIENINSPEIRISSLDGEMTSIIARLDFPKAKETSLPQSADISQVLLEVSSGKADVTFVEPAVAMEYIHNNPGKIKEVQGVKPLRVFPNVMIVAKGDIEFLSTLNIAIDELINNGFVDKVINKYEKYPHSFQRVAVPYMEN
jgi:ABC-type amino acid transport substrate-binding protein